MGDFKVLHMNGGVGETSYANNSIIQRNVILSTKPIMERALTNIYSSNLPKCITIADLGCSCGPNTLLVASEIIEAIGNTCRKLGLHETPPEVLIFLNDLSGNDFNTLFGSLSQFQHTLRKRKGWGCYFTGVPGSFYDRLFPVESLHFVHSSYSVHWLSKIPEGLESNKGNIYMSHTSLPSVLDAYSNQFHNDFCSFLKHRSMELVAGGHMVLTLVGRKSDDPSSQEGALVWELLAKALNDMVSEGLLDEEQVNSFNIPIYYPCPREIASIVEEQGSFIIDHLETFEIQWSEASYDDDHEVEMDDDDDDDAFSFMKSMRSVAEPLLLDHFPEEDDRIIEEVFHKYHENIATCMAGEKPKFINVVVSMHKKNKDIDLVKVNL